MATSSDRGPHVVIFPFPADSHVNTMLKLAEILCLEGGIEVTFLCSEFVYCRMIQHTEIHSRFELYRQFKFETLTDGLPEDHLRCGDLVTDMFHSARAVMRPVFRGMMAPSGRLGSGSGRLPVTSIIADGVLSFAVDVAKEIRVPCILFRTVSASCFWAYSCIPQLIDAGDVPFEGNDLDKPITVIPGMEGCLRRGDLPGFCRCDDLADATLQFVIHEAQRNFGADGLMFNTFEELESPTLDCIKEKVPRLYAIGPIHAHLRSRSYPEAKSFRGSGRSSRSWKENGNCMEWLDNQPGRSVVYVSFGTVVVMTPDQFVELLHGLVNSGKRFLWVVRPGSVSWAGRTLPDELVKVIGERGHIVEWAPQEEVLDHPAVGAFLTHAGWNSVLEAVTAGVPMICWPRYADQFLNARFVSEVWKVGLDMKGTKCDKDAVERMVREVLDERNEEFRGSSESLKKFAAPRCGSQSRGGSTSNNYPLRGLDGLIQDIKRTVCLD